MGLLYKAKEKIKNTIKKMLDVRISKNSFFSAWPIIDDKVFFKWKLSKEHEKNYLANKDHYLCIRIYDITNSNSNKDSTCIMKEVMLKKDSKERIVADFIAGMTYRYAINLNEKIRWIYFKNIKKKYLTTSKICKEKN